MKLRFQAAEDRSESFREYDRLLKEFQNLERIGNGDSGEAKSIRDAMEWLYRRLSKEEISYFKSLSRTLYEERNSLPCTGKNILSSDVEIKGSIKVREALFIDGNVEGEISSDGVLTIGENAHIRGEIRTKSIIIFGKVHGNIAMAERCELRSKCTLEGDLRAARLIIEEGATFIGKSEVACEVVPSPGHS
jgi:cytoskeletal protein CcmA (bactofilin family)